MDLKHLNDRTLFTDTLTHARHEREIMTVVLHHLQEIDKRRLFCDHGCDSIFQFAVKKLGYSEDQAARRVSAMRLLRDLPQIEEQISSGDLSLSHLGMAQSFFRQESKISQRRFTAAEKMQVLAKIAKTSVRQAQAITISLSSAPEQLRPEKIKPISEDFSELRITISSELENKIHKLKGLLAHKHSGGISTAELLNLLCDLGLQKWDPCLQKESKTATSRNNLIESSKQTPKPQTKTPATAIQNSTSSLRKISTSQRRRIWQQAHGKCKNCGSQYALQIDHCLPIALGGDSAIENLRLLCRHCNQRAAIRQFGVEKMVGCIAKGSD